MADRDMEITAVQSPHFPRSSASTSVQEKPSTDGKDFAITIEEPPLPAYSDSSIKEPRTDEKGGKDAKDFAITVVEEPLSSGPSSVDLPRTGAKFALQNATAKSTAFIQEWTPFLLVASYFVFSTCIYMVCTARLISIFWFIYLSTNFYIAGTTVTEAFISIEPCRDARKVVERLAEKNWVFPTPDDQCLILDLVIVAYLPNEKDIIMDRIQYLCEKIIYPADKIRINVVYNTPKPIEPLETEMRSLASKYSNLRIHKVLDSTSKADNLNYFFTLDTGADVIAIYDCDHYPHPYGPRHAMERFHQDKTVDIVQGRCIVFNAADTLITGMISVEFDKIYAVSHPGRATMFGFGLFTGSNGYWRADLIRELRMDDSMLTEDIDSSLRSIEHGAKTVHDLNVVSYELAPTTLKALWSQRLRWAQGWAQASIKHIPLIFSRASHGSRDVKTRFGILSLLIVREWSYYLVTQYFCLVLSIVITAFPKSAHSFAKFIYFQYPVSEWLFIISLTCLIATLVITFRVKSEFITPGMIVMFSAFYPVYLVLMAVVGLYGHARQVSKYSSWNPTAR
ncbi:MAG: hypothetical protein M1819_002081 [Sarea resinae]|nr:MAG: hypothetical protein M1819_002081 [Sarea resinae]